VLIEKPSRGDFRPVLDGGFDLQFAPLMEYREGKGVVLFCQLDVTGRTEADPAAKALAENLFRYAATWKPEPLRKVVYAGEPAGQAHLKSCGIDAASYDGQGLSPAAQVLVVGPGGGMQLRGHAGGVGSFVKDGGYVLAIGLDQQEVDAILPFKLTLKDAEHISAAFDPPGVQSLLAGVGAADVHTRGPFKIPLVVGGAAPVGDGVLAVAQAERQQGAVVFCQLAPCRIDYQPEQHNLKRTFRRTSFAVGRLLANLGAGGATPLLPRFTAPAPAGEKRWLDGLYVDTPEEWDDPYRFFRW